MDAERNKASEQTQRGNDVERYGTIRGRHADALLADSKTFLTSQPTSSRIFVESIFKLHVVVHDEPRVRATIASVTASGTTRTPSLVLLNQWENDGTPLEGADGTVDDLKTALVENLEARGVIGKLKAQVRAEIFRTLEGPQDGTLRPTPCNDNLLINELLRDYLSYNGCDITLGVFMAESGQPDDEALDRRFISDELGLTERRGSGKQPLLYGIIHALKRWKEDCSKRRGGRGYGKGGVCVCGAPSRVPVDPGHESEVAQDGNVIPTSEQEIGWGSGSVQNTAGLRMQDPAPILFAKKGYKDGDTVLPSRQSPEGEPAEC